MPARHMGNRDQSGFAWNDRAEGGNRGPVAQRSKRAQGPFEQKKVQGMLPMRSGELEFRKFVSPEVIFGFGCRNLAGRFALNLGATRVLVVSDPGVAAAGWTHDVEESLEASQIPYDLYLDVSPNPRSDQVARGAEAFVSNGCDLVLGVGGGSPIDCAKGIGILSSNGRDILDYVGADRLVEPVPPLICVPTTASAADVSQFCIITDVARRTKVSILSKMLVPDVSLTDPETLLTMPALLTANTALDALTHAIEAYLSNGSSPTTDLFALEAIRLINGSLIPGILEPGDRELRRRLMQAALDAGLAFSNAGLGVIHAMAHALGGLLDLPHGLCNVMLMQAGLEYNFEAVPDRYAAIAEALGVGASVRNTRRALDAILERIAELRRQAGVTPTLGGCGVRIEDIPLLAEKALTDLCMATNPRWPTRLEIESLYARSL